MMRIVEPSTWPASGWDALPPGACWLTVQRAPVPYIRVREEGSSDEVFAWVGRPFPLDPKRRYQVRNIADPVIDGFTSPAPTDGIWLWKSRTTKILLSDAPMPGGFCTWSATLQNQNAAGVTLSPMQWTTAGLKGAVVLFSTTGVISAVRTYAVEPDVAPATSVLLSTAINNTFVGHAWQQAGMTYSAAAGAYGFNLVPLGMLVSVVFPVTTTPTVVMHFYADLSANPN